MVDLSRGRTGCPDIGGWNRLPSMFGRAPECQRIPPDWSLNALGSGCRKRLIDVHFAPTVVGARDHGTAGTRFCPRVHRCEGKEGRDCRDSHQGELQAFSHSRVLNDHYEWRKSPPSTHQNPTRTKTSAPAHPQPEGEP